MLQMLIACKPSCCSSVSSPSGSDVNGKPVNCTSTPPISYNEWNVLHSFHAVNTSRHITCLVLNGEAPGRDTTQIVGFRQKPYEAVILVYHHFHLVERSRRRPSQLMCCDSCQSSQRDPERTSFNNSLMRKLILHIKKLKRVKGC